jgi:tetraacyldisaccharide 4'-kinase
LFAVLAWVRRLYHTLLPPQALRAPVIVVGNLTVGGTGKTPLTLWLVERLRVAGRHPGVISRGYGASGKSPAEVTLDSDPAVVGDEPVLIARRGQCPVWVGRRRTEAGRALLAAHPEVDVILSDDGLQHYALARDLEIVVIDGKRGFGNGLLLPAGPLREARSRLASVDALVVNGGDLRELAGARAYAMHLQGSRLYSLTEPTRCVTPDHFTDRAVHAVAAIGHPGRFFETLGRLGITVMPHAFPDHHLFRREDLPDGTVIMTEKDAVKCAAFGNADMWVLAVDAAVSDGLEQQVLEKLKEHHG